MDIIEHIEKRYVGRVYEIRGAMEKTMFIAIHSIEYYDGSICLNLEHNTGIGGLFEFVMESVIHEIVEYYGVISVNYSSKNHDVYYKKTNSLLGEDKQPILIDLTNK
jgi:hypothetical protein